MGNKLYVGNLPYSATQEQLKALFSEAGEVTEATIITDRETGRPKGFGFVTMVDDKAAEDAIQKFNGYDMEGRKLTVNEARPREERPQGGFRPRNGGRDFNQRY